MSLDVTLTDADGNEVYSANITHNLNRMAEEAGIYMYLWRPEEIGITKASELIEPVHAGLVLMVTEPARCERFNAPNGWGMYHNFVPWVARYVEACRTYPDATVSVSR